MINGAVDKCASFGDRGQNSVQFQKECDRGCYWTRRSHYKDCDNECETGKEQLSIYKVVSLFDSMVRGVSKRGVTRREYALCLLEESYPLSFKENTSESTVTVKRKFEDVISKSPRSVFGDQSFTYGNCKIKKSRPSASRGFVYDRQIADDTPCCRVFYELGGDVLAHWLTPVEFYNTKLALHHDWSWARVWHGGFVADKAFASFCACCLIRGASVDAFIAKYGKSKMFDILFYVLPANEYLFYVNKYNYIMGIRKLI
jgi:hypothetical protein